MSEELAKITTEIVSAYVAKNAIRPADVPDLIAQVHASLGKLLNGNAEPQAEAKLTPLLPIKKTIHHDYLISLEDGRRYKTLRRHLSTRGLTPDEYRAKWDLPADYPMVARGYSETRSGLAKSIGLGARKAAEAEPTVEQAAPVEEAAPVEKASKKTARPHPKAEQTRKRAPRTKKIDAEAPAEAQEAA